MSSISPSSQMQGLAQSQKSDENVASSVQISQKSHKGSHTVIEVYDVENNISEPSLNSEDPEPKFHKIYDSLRSVPSQLTILGFLCFLGPGMFCALNGLGGGGLHDPSAANTANVAVYATFAVLGFVSGPIVSKIGFRTAIALGGIGYGLYASSLLSYKLNGNTGFLIAGGIILGAFASLFWTSQGAMLIGYTDPASRGKYISLVWGIFNLGAGLGSLLVFILSLDSQQGGISVPTFAAFISLMFCGALGSVFICSRDKILPQNTINNAPVQIVTWTSAFSNLASSLRTHKRIIMLFPMFFVSNYYYPYIFNDMNLRTFNIRTRALNNTLFWMMEIPGSFLTGWILDQKRLSRPVRARFGYIFVLVLTTALWTGGCLWQKGYSGAVVWSPDFVPVDLNDSGYVASVILFMFYGFFDAVWQSFIFWLIGAIGDESEVAAGLTGFYKGLQSAGAAVAFRTNMLRNESLTDLVIVFAMLMASLIIAAPVILLKIRH